MREWLSYIDCDIEFSELEVDELWFDFHYFINEVIDQIVPLGCSLSKKTPNWMNRNANAAIKYKSRMLLRYRQSKSHNDMVEYKIAQRKVVEEYKKAKKQFERKLADDVKNNPKRFYAYMRSESKVKDSVGPLNDSYGQLVSEKKEMCNLLNEYFGSVFTTEIYSVNELLEVKYLVNEDASRMLSNIKLTTNIISNKPSKC